MRISPKNYNPNGLCQKFKKASCTVLQGSFLGGLESFCFGLIALNSSDEWKKTDKSLDQLLPNLAILGALGALVGGITAGTKIIISPLLKKTCRIDIDDQNSLFIPVYSVLSLVLLCLPPFLADAKKETPAPLQYGIIAGGILGGLASPL